MIHHRFEVETENLKKEHYIRGWGVDSSLRYEINEARKKLNAETGSNLPVMDDFHIVYDKRDGYYIDGSKIETRLHDLHSKSIYDKEKKRYLIIDTVIETDYYGKYIEILYRTAGTLSHGSILWKNISCKEPDFLEKFAKNKKRYELIDFYDDSEELADNQRRKAEKWEKIRKDENEDSI